MGVGGLQGVNAGLLPFVGLPANLGEGGLAAGPLLLGLLHAPAGEGEDDLRGQGQKVKEGVENLEVGGGEDLPQHLLHRRHQGLEAPVVLEGLGDVLGGVVRGPVVLQLFRPGGLNPGCPRR